MAHNWGKKKIKERSLENISLSITEGVFNY